MAEEGTSLEKILCAERMRREGTLSLNKAVEFGGGENLKGSLKPVCLAEDWVWGSTGLASYARSLCFHSTSGLSGKSQASGVSFLDPVNVYCLLKMSQTLGV